MKKDQYEVAGAEVADTLAETASRVTDFESLKAWCSGPVLAVVPHAAMLCGQSIAHAGGYAAIQLWAIGLPQSYLKVIARPGNNLQSPIFSRLLRSDGMP